MDRMLARKILDQFITGDTTKSITMIQAAIGSTKKEILKTIIEMNIERKDILIQVGETEEEGQMFSGSPEKIIPYLGSGLFPRD